MKKVKVRAKATVSMIKILTYELDESKDIYDQVCDLKEDYVLEDDFIDLTKGEFGEISLEDDLNFEILDDENLR
jgi:hypothetical protein